VHMNARLENHKTRGVYAQKALKKLHEVITTIVRTPGLFALIVLISATDLLIALIHTYFTKETTCIPILKCSLNRFSDSHCFRDLLDLLYLFHSGDLFVLAPGTYHDLFWWEGPWLIAY